MSCTASISSNPWHQFGTSTNKRYWGVRLAGSGGSEPSGWADEDTSTGFYQPVAASSGFYLPGNQYGSKIFYSNGQSMMINLIRGSPEADHFTVL